MLKYLFVPLLVSFVIAVLSTLVWVYFNAEYHGFMVALMNSFNTFCTVVAARHCSSPNVERLGGFVYLMALTSLSLYIGYDAPDLAFPWWHHVMMFLAGCFALVGGIEDTGNA